MMPKMSPVTMPSNVGRYAKAIIAALVAGLTVLGKALKDNGGHLAAADYIAAGVAFLLALGAVYTVPNLPQPQPPADPAPSITNANANEGIKAGLGAPPVRHVAAPVNYTSGNLPPDLARQVAAEIEKQQKRDSHGRFSR